MKKNIKKNWIWIIGIIVVSVIFLRISKTFSSSDVPEVIVPNPAVDIFTLGNTFDNVINTSCQVEPVSEVSITPEYSGVVTNVSVKEGDKIKKGDIIFGIENIQQRVAVADARVALESARSSLKELRDQNDTSSNSSLLAQTEQQQITLIESARNNLFNNDLRAYPLDDPENVTKQGPTIIGNYTCTQKGDYQIEVYRSSSTSGASFRYLGLESGTESVSTTGFGTKLGDCGLELIFPENFDKNEDWVIPVPNTRSSSYALVESRYRNAQENKNIAINQTGASSEVINQSQGRVNQAQLRYQLALDNLNKTSIKAKSSGVVTGFDLDEGDYVNAFSELGSIKTQDQLELVAFVNSDDRRYLSLDSKVTIADQETTINAISAVADSVTRKIKLIIDVPTDMNVIEGLSVACGLERQTDSVTRLDGGITIPLSSLSIIGIDSYVFAINEDLVTSAIPVTTGSILGEEIIVYDLSASAIVSDARGIRSGQKVTISNK